MNAKLMKPNALVLSCCLVAAVIVSAQAPAPQQERQATVPGIPGVVAAGAKVQRVWTGVHSADGIVGAPDGSLLFTEQEASRVSRIDEAGNVSISLDDTNGAGALAIDAKGRVIAVERLKPRVEILTPPRTVLADLASGQPLEAASDLSDLVVDKKGGVYFTATRMPPHKSATYYVKPTGQVVLAQDDLRGNGVLLSRDERVLYFTDTPGQFIVAYDVQPDGSITNRRNFGAMIGPGADGITIDDEGRLYLAGPAGIQVLGASGELLGTIPMPRPTTSVAFAGRDKKTLFVVGRGNDSPDGAGRWARSIYKVPMLAQGFKGRAK